MALGFFERPGVHTSSLGILVVHEGALKPVPLPRQARVSVPVSSSWKQQGFQNCSCSSSSSSSTHELSSFFLDILKERSESGLRNDGVEREDNGSGGDSYVRRRRGGDVEDERRHETSGSYAEREGWAWTLENKTLDEDSRSAGMGHRPKLAISRSYPSIPAKFSKYTRGRAPNVAPTRSLKVRQQLRENNVQNREYFREKAAFFQNFVSPVVKPELPCQFSYSEHPGVAPIGFREPVYSPFGPDGMARPWTGKRPYEPKQGLPAFDSFKLPPAAMTKAKFVEPPGPFVEGKGPKLGRTREEILGDPLSKDEVRELVATASIERRQLDLGKDGLTHNMLDLLHRHWKRRRVCRIKCYGVPTVDMDNLCRVIEDKSGGKIIRRSKSMLYVFRGRNYNWATRPGVPLMLWKPPAPIYPPVAQRVPEGLSVEEADHLRAQGRRAHCLCRLKKAGMYQNLVKTVRGAFEVDEVVKVDCRELDRSDMKKIGAKLRDLVPCVPLSFDRHFMVLWKGLKVKGEKRTEGDTSGAEEIGSQGHQDSEFTYDEARSNVNEQLCANILEAAEKINSSDHGSQVNNLHEEPEEATVTDDDNSGDQVEELAMTQQSLDMNATPGSDVAVMEFDRLWEEAIKSNDVVTVESSEADLESVSQSRSGTSNSWEEDDHGRDEDGTDSSSGSEVDQDGDAEELLPSSLTDITIPPDEWERLCALRLTIKGWMKIGRPGITRGIVKSIHSKWLVSEVAKVRCVASGCNMLKVHEELERLTGGKVIWRKGPAVVIYRGRDYVPGWMRDVEEREEAYRERLQSLGLEEEEEKPKENKPQTTKIEEREIDELLDELGPEYTEWTESGHSPVDADLLIPPDSGFKRPFRRLPYGVRPRLTNFEMTEMRHLASALPPHFALGKRRGLEGLASAVVQLWEKSEVAKVAMKRGVSRIDNDRMAAELMRLTGGDLVARNMSYIALFRGNDFLPPAVKDILEAKDHAAASLLEEEEKTRLAGFRNGSPAYDAALKPSNAGTLAESLEQEARWKNNSNQTLLARKAARDQALRRMQKIIKAVSLKIDRTEGELTNVNLKMRPKDTSVENERISEEEMYTLRKIGLRMKPFLLLGRREVFGGIIENMHLNWKWRELVKVVVKKSYFMYREKDEVEKIARMLEAESGGVLMGICPIPVGVAIIVYRGKLYQRPVDGISPEGHPFGLRPPGLLTKKQAWQRFNQKRRKLSLERHLRKLEMDFNNLQTDLKKLEEQDANLNNEGGKNDFTLTN